MPVRDLVRTALRMRPDRIVVGEVRGGEALDLLQALNTGHEGALSTVHANGPVDALRRLATLALFSGVALPFAAITEQVAAAVDVVVQVERGRSGARAIVGDRRGAERARRRWARGRCSAATAGGLVPVGSPTRALRRRDAPAPEASWFG